MIAATDTDGGAEFTVKVLPRSSKTAIAGEAEGIVRIKIASPPVDGAANIELVKFLSKVFGVSKTSVKLVSGAQSRQKRVLIAGVTAAEVREKLTQLTK
jgi:uncharacterized protein